MNLHRATKLLKVQEQLFLWFHCHTSTGVSIFTNILTYNYVLSFVLRNVPLVWASFCLLFKKNNLNQLLYQVLRRFHPRSSLLLNYKCIAIYNSGISRKSVALIVRYSQKKKCITFVFYCSENLSIVITLEPLVRFRWGFQQNVPHLLMRISIK